MMTLRSLVNERPCRHKHDRWIDAKRCLNKRLDQLNKTDELLTSQAVIDGGGAVIGADAGMAYDDEASMAARRAQLASAVHESRYAQRQHDVRHGRR